jgi:hypothetical protein
VHLFWDNAGPLVKVMSTSRTAARAVVIVLTLGVVFAHNLWSASSSGNPFRFGPEVRDYYNLLADALQAGTLSLPITPDPALLRLPDPYDPVANRAFRIPYVTHDLSLKDGRYYLYFGISPALTLFLPFRWLTGLRLPENLAAALLLFATAALGLAILRWLVRRHYPDAPFAVLPLAALFFGFCGFAPFILRRPATYEVALAAGAFFALAAIGGLLRGWLGESSGRSWLALGSLAVGLAIAARPTQILLLLILAAVLAGRAYAPSPHAGREVWRDAWALGLPAGLCIAVLMALNYVRFGSPLEFGIAYQISEWKLSEVRLFAFSYFPRDFVLNFLSPPRLGLEFPFFTIAPAVPPVMPAGHLSVDTVAGIVPCVPLVLLAFVWPILWRRQPTALTAAGTAVWATGIAGALLLSFYGVVTVRYVLDYLPPLLLVAALGAVHVDSALGGRPRLRLAYRAAAIVLLVYSVVLNLAIGLTGYYHWLERRNPATYAAIEEAFAPVQKRLLEAGPRRYGDATLTLGLPRAAPGASEVLLAAGGMYRHDVLCIRYAEGGRIQLRFHHRGEEAIKSRLVGVDADRPLTVEVALGSLYPINARALARLYPADDVPGASRRLRVTLQGQEVLSGSYDFIPSPPDLVSFGRDRFDNGQCTAPFSGQILKVERAFPRR